MRYLKITWSNSTDLGSVLYSTGYENRIYLDVEVERPDYRVTVESELDGDNHELETFRKWEKAYRFEVWGTEDLADAFTFMQIHDTISVTLQTGETISVDQMRVDYDWDECLCKMTVTFTDSYVVGTNCDEDLDTGCVCDESTEFGGFVDYADIGTTSGIAGDIIFFYTEETLANYIYKGEFWQLGTTGAYDWTQLETNDGDCFEETTLALGNFYKNGEYWLIYPGKIASIIPVAGDTFNMKLYLTVPYTFCEILYTGDATGSAGIWPVGEFYGPGVDFDLPGSGNYDVYCHIYNHSCDYGNTDSEAVNY